MGHLSELSLPKILSSDSGAGSRISNRVARGSIAAVRVAGQRCVAVLSSSYKILTRANLPSGISRILLSSSL